MKTVNSHTFREFVSSCVYAIHGYFIEMAIRTHGYKVTTSDN